nr:class I SAM-dependent methyltransferase [Aequorivita xiaoshiensis]
MTQVYEKKLWGSNNTDFYSGEGSHHPDLVDPYINAVTSFLNSFEEPITVCDLGCGDFNIGKELFKHTKRYIAVDIVEALIQRNKQLFKADNLEFYCLDIAVNNLPSGDCVLLRQVLQHLSNSEVQQIVSKLGAYKYVVLTEHLPEGEFIPNKDIISGQGIRLKKQSGINLLLPPFNMKVIDEIQLLAIQLKDRPGVIVTTLYKLF